MHYEDTDSTGGVQVDSSRNFCAFELTKKRETTAKRSRVVRGLCACLKGVWHVCRPEGRALTRHQKLKALSDSRHQAAHATHWAHKTACMHNVEAHVTHHYQQDHSELSSVTCICEAPQSRMLPRLCPLPSRPFARRVDRT